jgi:hypothetical protein
MYGGELPQGGPPELHGRPIHDSPLNPGADFAAGRGAVPLGTMLPPPNLVGSRFSTPKGMLRCPVHHLSRRV